MNNLQIVKEETTNNDLMFSGLDGSTNKFYTSLKTDSEDEKAKIFNVATSSDKRLKDMVGKVLSITDIFVQAVDVVNEETKEKVQAPRIVLIDDKGNAYGCVSIGILSALERIVGIYGSAPWSPPLKLEPTIVSTGKLNTVLSLKAHLRGK